MLTKTVTPMFIDKQYLYKREKFIVRKSLFHNLIH